MRRRLQDQKDGETRWGALLAWVNEPVQASGDEPDGGGWAQFTAALDERGNR